MLTPGWRVLDSMTATASIPVTSSTERMLVVSSELSLSNVWLLWKILSMVSSTMPEQRFIFQSKVSAEASLLCHCYQTFYLHFWHCFKNQAFCPSNFFIQRFNICCWDRSFPEWSYRQYPARKYWTNLIKKILETNNRFSEVSMEKKKVQEIGTCSTASISVLTTSGDWNSISGRTSGESSHLSCAPSLNRNCISLVASVSISLSSAVSGISFIKLFLCL